jgi:PhoH-like ATPase
VRTYVLDTSVLLADPAALGRFDEHEVVLPVVVVSELEAKRHHPELGYFARSALRRLDELRVLHGRLDAPVPIGDGGGSLRVELNHTDPRCCLPDSGSVTTTPGSSRWLANLALGGAGRDAGHHGPALRVRLGSVGLARRGDTRAELVPQSGWTGWPDGGGRSRRRELYDDGRRRHRRGA